MRFIVVDGSDSGHCCFDWSVRDTERPDDFGKDSTICECTDEEAAEMIVRALNGGGAP